MTSVMVACPSNRGVSGPTVESLNDTVEILAHYDFDIFGGPKILTGLPIDLARCIILRNFLDSGADILMSFDDDESWPASDAVAMARMVEAGSDFISGVYAKKRIDTGRLKAAALADLDGQELSEDIAEGPALALWEPPGRLSVGDHNLVRCRWVGAGALCLSRAGVVRMVEAYPKLLCTNGLREIPALFLPMVYNGQYLTEDCAYCQRWIDIGGEIWAMTTSRFVHWGSFPYRIALDKRLGER
jgi:hypothetical protein